MGHRMLWTAALVLCFGVGLVVAQDKPKVQSAIGPVAKVQGTMLIVDTGGGKSLQFITSSATTIEIPAGGARGEESVRERGKKLSVTEAVHVGDQVEVKYTDVGGKLMAQSIHVKQQRPPSALPQK